MRYRAPLGLVLALGIVIAAPIQSAASRDICSAEGYSVVYINGIFTDETKARADKKEIYKEYAKRYFNLTEDHFRLGYNPTHLGGLGDVFKSIQQKAWEADGGTKEDFDLLTIARQLSTEVKTQKILIIGHSQGTFYANALYDYLIRRGVSANSIAVYNIATPASYVSGHGPYLTNKNDAVINEVRKAAQETGYPQPLKANVEIETKPEDAENPWAGHSIADVYLVGQPTGIAATISSLLLKLEGDATRDSREPCIPPPESSVSYLTKKIAFAVGDPVGSVARPAIALANTVGTTIADPFVSAGKKLAGVFGKVFAQGPNTQVAATAAALEEPALEIHEATATQPSPEENAAAADIERGPQNPGADVTDDTSVEVVPAAPLAPASPPPLTQNPPALLIGPGGLPNLVPGEGGWGGGGGGSIASATQNAPEAPAEEAEPEEEPQQEEEPEGENESEEEPEEEEEPEPDLVPPDAPAITIAECAYSLSNDLCLVPETTVTIIWDSVEDNAEYAVYVNSVRMATTTGTSASVTLSDNAESAVFIVASDAAGNAATSTTETATIISQPLVINEVAWAGTTANGEDEWIELKNLSGYDITMERLALTTADGAPTIMLDGILPAVNPDNNTDIYLIERASGATTADHNRVTLFEQLSDSGEELRLVHPIGNGTTTIDRTPSVAECDGWCAGSLPVAVHFSPEKGTVEAALSMERIGGVSDGSLAASWRSNDTYTKSASDAAGNDIYGTPSRESSTGIPSTGWYCDPDTESIASGSAYTPESTSCTYLSGFIHPQALRWGALFKGVPGDAEDMFAHSIGKGSVSAENFGGGIVGIEGDDFFVGIFETRTFGTDLGDFMNWFKYGTTTAGSIEPPHSNYRIIEWVYGS